MYICAYTTYKYLYTNIFPYMNTPVCTYIVVSSAHTVGVLCFFNNKNRLKVSQHVRELYTYIYIDIYI